MHLALEVPLVSCSWESTKRGGVPILRCHGDIDFGSGDRLRASINEAAESHGHRVIVDLSDVSYIESSPIGVLLGCAISLRRHSGILVTVASPGHVARLVRLMGLDSALVLCPTLDVAYDCAIHVDRFRD